MTNHNEIMDLTDAEREAKNFLQSHYGIEDENIEIESAELIEIAGMPIYKIKGTAVEVVRRGFFSEEEIVYDFEIKIHALNGRIVGKKFVKRTSKERDIF